MANRRAGEQASEDSCMGNSLLPKEKEGCLLIGELEAGRLRRRQAGRKSRRDHHPAGMSDISCQLDGKGGRQKGSRMNGG
jgi:hypothetical protein